MFVTIQPRENAGVRPYPFHVNPDGTVRRQDFWKGKVTEVIGFARELEVQSLDLPWEEFDPATNPDEPVGMFVVTADNEGYWSTEPVPVESVRVQPDTTE